MLSTPIGTDNKEKKKKRKRKKLLMNNKALDKSIFAYMFYKSVYWTILRSTCDIKI